MNLSTQFVLIVTLQISQSQCFVFPVILEMSRVFCNCHYQNGRGFIDNSLESFHLYHGRFTGLHDCEA